jgi:transcriptional regulator with XRE-family HTH domain
MKKTVSQRSVPQLAKKLGAKPSEFIELLGVSRNYAHKLATGERPLTGRVLEKIAQFEQHAPSKSQRVNSNPEIPKSVCERRSWVIQKKINDLTEELEVLQQTEEALVYVAHVREKLVVKSREHDWCTLQLRRLKHRLPEHPDLQRAEWEAKLAGLLAEQKYWVKKGG